MSDPVPSAADLERIKASLTSLEARFEALEERVASLTISDEGPRRTLPNPSDSAAVPLRKDADESADPGRSDAVGLVGRTLIVLGGAYLLRAITEFAVLPGAVGSALGFAYASTFLWLANRDATAGKVLSARFHGWIAIAIACGIVWESATRFEILPPYAAAAVMLGFAAIALEIANRRALIQVAWFLTMASGGVLAGLVVATKTIVPYGAALLLLVVLTIRAGRFLDRRGLAALAGVLVDGVMLVLAVLSISNRSPDGFVPSVLLLSGYFVFFSVVVARRVVRDRSDPSVMGVAHIAAATVIGALGAMRAAVVAGAPVSVGVAYLAVAPLSYSFGFAMRSVSRRAFSVFTTLGLVLVIASSTLTLPSGVCVILWLSGVFVAWVASSREESGALDLQISVYLWAAGVASGSIALAIRSLVLAPGASWGRLSESGVAVIVCTVVSCLFALKPRPESADLRYHLPRVGAFALLSLLTGGILVMLIVRGFLGDAPDPALVALVRTVMIATTAVVFAWLSRYDRFWELSMLVYLILGLGGIKLLAEDLRVGRPGTLFITFALFGAVLIAVPKLRRSRRSRMYDEAVTPPAVATD